MVFSSFWTSLSFGVCFCGILTSNVWASPVMSKLIDDRFMGYDKRLRPYYFEQPLEVTATAYVISVSTVDEINEVFTISIFFRQHWVDPRLKYDAPKPNFTHITLDADTLNKIWSPDTFILNEVKSYRNDITLPNEVIRISPFGEIMKSSRLTITALCPMDLQNFPFNELECNIEFESYNHKTDELFYNWKQGTLDSTDIGDGLGTHSYNLVSAKSLSHQINVTSGNYSQLIIQMKLQRLMGRFILGAFIPTLTLVLLSLLTLWIANMKISTIISFLNMGIMILVMAVLNSATDIPKVSYLTALDMHMLLCIVFILCVVIVNVTMFYFVKKAARLSTIKKNKSAPVTVQPTINSEEGETVYKSPHASPVNSGKSNLVAKRTGIVLDILWNMKYVLVVSFASLELAYWIYYLS